MRITRPPYKKRITLLPFDGNQGRAGRKLPGYRGVEWFWLAQRRWPEATRERICATALATCMSKNNLPNSGVEGRGSPVTPLATRGVAGSGRCLGGSTGSPAASLSLRTYESPPRYISTDVSW